MNIQMPKISQNMDTNFLKIIGIITMLLDHLGKCLFPDIIILQIIGRIAFPIFAYCLVVGFIYTSNLKKYIFRLTLFFFISQPIYTLAFHPTMTGFKQNILIPNIFLDLVLGIIVLFGIKEGKWWISISATVLCVFLNAGYGIGGLTLILSFYLFREKSVLSFIIVGLQLLLPFLMGYKDLVFGYQIGIQGFAILSMPFIYLRTNFKPRISKYFFYIFYPAHLGVLFILRLIFRV